MDLKGIISISGMSGLYRIVATNKNGFIVESFGDKKRFAVSSAQRVSTLEDITIYTEDGDASLKDVLKTLDEKSGKEITPDPKADPDKLKKDMETLLPDYDKERVYNSDIKKLFSWYLILKESDFSFEDEPEKEEEKEEAKKSEKENKVKSKSKPPKEEETKTAAKKKAKKGTTKGGEKAEKENGKKASEKTSTKKKTASAKSTSNTTTKKSAAKKKSK